MSDLHPIPHFGPEHVRAIERAIHTLHADLETAQRWDKNTPRQLALDLENLEELRDRMLGQQATADNTRWSRQAPARLGVVR